MLMAVLWQVAVLARVIEPRGLLVESLAFDLAPGAAKV